MTRILRAFVVGLGAFLLLFFVTVSLSDSTALASGTTCDLCGKCGNQQPSDYDQCVQCIYDDPATPASPKSGYSWTVLGCLQTSPDAFVQQIMYVATMTVGGVIFIVLLYGSFILLTSTGDPERIAQGKTLIKSSIIALLLVIFSFFILSFVGNDILRIPGLGEG